MSGSYLQTYYNQRNEEKDKHSAICLPKFIAASIMDQTNTNIQTLPKGLCRLLSFEKKLKPVQVKYISADAFNPSEPNYFQMNINGRDTCARTFDGNFSYQNSIRNRDF